MFTSMLLELGAVMPCAMLCYVRALYYAQESTGMLRLVCTWVKRVTVSSTSLATGNLLPKVACNDDNGVMEKFPPHLLPCTHRTVL